MQIKWKINSAKNTGGKMIKEKQRKVGDERNFEEKLLPGRKLNI